MGPISSRSRRVRGASMVEYALIVVAVLLLAAGSYKLLGGALSKRSSAAGDTVAGTATGGGATGGSGSMGAGGGASGGGGKATATMKVSVGVTGGAGRGSTTGGGSSASGQEPAAGDGSTGRSGDLTEGFTTKRWFGIGLLAAGVAALGYVLVSMRRAKNAAAALAKSKLGMR